MTEVTVQEAECKLRGLIDRAIGGDEVYIRDGAERVVRLVPVDELESADEVARDEAIWSEQFEKTPPAKLAALEREIRESIAAGQTRPLDFTGR